MNTTFRFFPRVCAGIALLGWFFAVSAGAVPFVQRHNMSAATFQSEYDFWTAAPYQYRLTRLCGTEVSGAARYTAIFEQSAKTTRWTSRLGLTATEFINYNASVQLAGYRLYWLDAFVVGPETFYNGLWEDTNGPAQRIRLGQTLGNHQTTNTANEAAGFYRTDVSSCAFSGTGYHSAIWREGSDPDYFFTFDQSWSTYQTSFIALNNAEFQLWRVSGYELGAGERFSSVWRRSALGWSLTGMRDDVFESQNRNAQYQGYRPVAVEPYQIGGETRYNAQWARNGGFGNARLAEINAAVDGYLTEHSLPGLSLAIMREGRLVYARGFGFANTATGEQADPLHRWRIASTSKTVCAVATLRALEDSPTWSLDSKCFGPGALFGNDFGNIVSNPYSTNEKKITIRHLLNMTAGWDDDSPLWFNDNVLLGTNHAAIIGFRLDNNNPFWAPGTHARYNNFNYAVAARVPEKITGLSFEDYCEREIFTPCGMTAMGVGGRTAANRLSGEVAYYEGTYYGPPEAVWPARMDGSTAWVARPMELLLMARRIDGNPRHRDIIGGYALSQMRLANGQPDANNNASSYGMGWYPSTRHGQTWWQHNGSMAGTQAILCISEDGSQAFAYATNSVDSSDRFSNQFRNLVLDQMNEVQTTPVEPGQSSAWPEIDLFNKYNPAYDEWAQTAFSNRVTTRTGTASEWAPSADPDGDERCNALEAYLGSDPTVAERSPFLVYASDDHLVMRWTKKNGDRGVVAVAQWSSALQTFSGLGAEIINRPDLLNMAGTMIQEARVPRSAGIARRFLRLAFATP